MDTDGNTYAINREIEAQEAYDAEHHSDDLYCPSCDEFIDGADETCPDCSGELEETQ